MLILFCLWQYFYANSVLADRDDALKQSHEVIRGFTAKMGVDVIKLKGGSNA
jgi:hypothetical protein